MSSLSDHVHLRLLAPLGDDALLLRRIEGQETMDEGFRFTLEVEARDADVVIADLLGKEVTATITLADDPERPLHGLVTEVREGPLSRHGVLILEPFLHPMGLGRDFRVFQDQTVGDIIAKILEAGKVAASLLEDHSEAGATVLPLCVQYGESDRAFLQRLLEEHGISSFFRHEDGQHVLCLIDRKDDYTFCPGAAQARYELPPEDDAEATKDQDDRETTVSFVELRAELRAGTVIVDDYDPEHPQSALDHREGEDGAEVFEYPARVPDLSAEGSAALCRIRAEETKSGARTLRCRSRCPAFRPGHTFKLVGHPRLDGTYLITAVTHRAHDAARRLAGPRPGETLLPYENELCCVPAEEPYRPRRRAPRPCVRGPETAVVVGDEGKEIHADKDGRVKVQFRWDRDGKCNAKSFAWVRVTQALAGKRWGAHFLPRVGQEVLVHFLYGDPDRPVISGALYNGTEKPPWNAEKSEEAAISGLRTLATPGGGGGHELIFDDSKGKERLALNSHGALHMLARGSRHDGTGGDEHHKVGGDRRDKVDGKWAQVAGGEIVIEASAITLSAGGSFVQIGPEGVTAKGALVKLNCGGGPPAGAGAPPEGPKAAGPAGEVNTRPRC